MNSLEIFLSSNSGKKLFNIFYSWGAAIVIIGAMFKIIHLPYANQILMIGMITEALVFFISGFDHSSGDSIPAGSGIIVGGAAFNGDVADTNTIEASKGQKGIGSSAGSVVIVGGGNVHASGGVAPGGIAPATPGEISSGTNQRASLKTGNAPGYNQSISDTAQNLEDFSNTIQSLNEASQKLLTAYNQITETNGFVDNLATLNQNVSGLNDVFSAQLNTITEQMSAIRYINDSLNRMKNLYDGAIGDSYMFKEESAKMTKHIEALNNVYARLLQAMTTNNNPNQPKF
ncbi:MAG: gliding motility protein GldL [Prevotella sp.]|nr:gliding motility protein GldL [Prevotella sp.]